MLDLENFGLVELNAQEVLLVEGGGWQSHVVSFVKGLLAAII